jgi:hypothetical protein
MPTFRISLAALMAIIGVIALGLAGMVSASRFWTASAATVTLALLLAAILSARLSDGTERPISAGFALFGWTYLLLVNWDWVGGQFGHDLTAGLNEVAEAIFPEVRAPVIPTSPAASLPGQIIQNMTVRPAQTPAELTPVPSPTSPVVNQFDYLELVHRRQTKIGNFVQIGRMLLSLLFALVGGFLGRLLAQRRESRSRTAEQARTASTPREAGDRSNLLIDG